MNEVHVIDRHFVAPLSDDEHLELKVQAARANIKIKDWVSRAIREKLYTEYQPEQKIKLEEILKEE